MFKSDQFIQKLIIAKLLRSKQAVEAIVPKANPKDFTDGYLRSIYQLISQHYDKYNSVIGKAELAIWNKKRCKKMILTKAKKKKDAIKNYEAVRSLIKSLYAVETFKSYGECLDEFILYKEEKEFGEALFGAYDIYNTTEDLKAAKAIIRANLDASVFDTEFQYSDYIDNWEVRQEQRLYELENPNSIACIPTGFPYLDGIIGGIRSPEIFTVVANTGVGKSIFLNQQAYFTLAHKFDVVYVTLENSIKQVEQRLDSRLTRILYDSLRTQNYSSRELEQTYILFEKIRSQINKKIHVYFVPRDVCTSSSLVRIWNDAKRRGIDPKRTLYIVDYLDLVSPDTVIRDPRLSASHVYSRFKSFITEENIPSWTATQANKESEGKVATAKSLSEAYDKARICDGIVTLNEKLLYMAKFRDHKDSFMIPIIMEKERMIIRQDNSLWSKKDQKFIIVKPSSSPYDEEDVKVK